MDVLLQGIEMTTFQVGLASIRLYPRGNCSCGHLEVVDGAQVRTYVSEFICITRASKYFFLTYRSIFQPPLYVTAGKVNTNYLKDSLFDKNALENRGKKRDYKQGTINYHLVTASGIYRRQ